MKKLIVMGSVIAVLFGLSAAASYFMRMEQAKTAEHAEHAEAPSHEKSLKGSASHAVTASATVDNRPAVRPPVNPDIDSAAQLANSLRTQMDALKTREQQFIAREKSLDLIAQDIRLEKSSMDEMRKQLNEELKGLSERIELLERKSGEVDQKRKQLSDQGKELTQSMLHVEESEKSSIKRLAAVYDSMDADAAAQHLQQMADSGKIDTAVKILNSMRERQAAKVLAQFPDKTTVPQLLDRMRTLDRNPLPAKTDNNPPPLPGGGSLGGTP